MLMVIGTDDLATEIGAEAFLDGQLGTTSRIGNRKRETLKLLVSKTHRAAGQTFHLGGRAEGIES